MITSKKDYIRYLAQDRKALGIKKPTFKNRLIEHVAPNHIYKFQKLLRKKEYYLNCKKGLVNKILYQLIKLKFRNISIKLGFTIPENVFGPGLAIVHYGTIVVNGNARIGKNCRIHACTNIGASGGSKKAPRIGDNVYIGPGAKIYGDISIGNNIAIGANATVFKNFEESGVMIAGNPAKVIKQIDIKRIIKHIK